MATFMAKAAAGAAQNLLSGAAATDQWTTQTFQCGGVAPLDWFLGCCCGPCAAAKAKSNADLSNPLYNLMCWTPLGAYSYVRYGYRIIGDCGTDCVTGMCCMPCAARQIYTESNVRGAQPGGHFGGHSREWHSSHWDCGCTELCFATMCPCVITNTVRQIVQPGTEQWFNMCCVLPTATYGLVRNSYGLEAAVCGEYPCVEDVLYGAGCYPCALARAQREAAWQRANDAAGDTGSKLMGVGAKLAGVARMGYGALKT